MTSASSLDALAAQLRAALDTSDKERLVFLLRTCCLSRSPVEHGDYQDAAILALRRLLLPDTTFWATDVAQYTMFFKFRRQYGRSALLLSGGATFSLVHAGIVKRLWEQRLLPRILSGSSGGSIIAAIFSCTTDDALPSLFRPGNVDLNFFAETTTGSNAQRISSIVSRVITKGVLYDNAVLERCLERNLGDITFLEAYNRTRRILNITVSSSGVHESTRLLNFITAPNVLVRSAVACSCAVPFMYESSRLLAKCPDGSICPWALASQEWIDGSIESDLPMQKLRELFNVNHFIVCQVNPHVIPFLQSSPDIRIVSAATHMAMDEMRHRLAQLAEFGVFPVMIHMLESVASQQYTGDITVTPTIHWWDYFQLVRNPSWIDLIKWTRRGERAIDPRKFLSKRILRLDFPLDMRAIKQRLKVELELDESLYQLRLRRLASVVHDADTHRAGEAKLSARSSSTADMRFFEEVAGGKAKTRRATSAGRYRNREGRSNGLRPIFFVTETDTETTEGNESQDG